MQKEEERMELPAVALRALVIVPGMIIHFDLSRNKSIQAVEKALEENSEIFLVAQKNPEIEEPIVDELYTVGTIAIVKQITKLPEGIVRVFVEGKKKARIIDVIEEKYFRFVIEPMEMGEVSLQVAEAMYRTLKDELNLYASVHPQVGHSLLKNMEKYQELDVLLEAIMNYLPFQYKERQKYLETSSMEEAFACLMELLRKESEIGKIRMQLGTKVRERIEKNQKEYVLKEQLQYIQEELGISGEDHLEYEKQLAELEASDEVKKKIQKEIKKLHSIPSSSAEYGVEQNYVETLLAMPWEKKTMDNHDFLRAEKILNKEHFGLDEVKEKVLEFLAVRALTKKGDSPILCLVGPPGTGKTSIAKSIATAMNREYVRICLGGVRDEAEIRGHRKTYLGAMPGRIVTGLKQAKVSNPVMLLDEIDKTGKDQRGDTASALLEVLDGEQNIAFRDHYLEIPIDLSEVVFVATANSLDTIPRPLLDRMEVVEVHSYTNTEKFHIAKKYLYPKQLQVNGLENGQLKITDAAIKKIIQAYTKEAGVRNLERKIGTICKKAAWKILKEKVEKVVVDARTLSEFLGMERYRKEVIHEKNMVGVVRGLAWTSVGGVTLEVEVNTMPGKGSIELTGQLGDVMKESAKTALSYVRANASNWKIDPQVFEKTDVHIHVPEGATPKDGPSAGITMTTAIISAFTNTLVKREVAMTGEVTLRGRVLAIGGLKEKLLAAIAAGCKIAVVPEQNRSDVAELSKDITSAIEIHFVSDMAEVLELALEEKANGN